MKKGISKNITPIVILFLILSLFVINSINFVQAKNTTMTSEDPVIDNVSELPWGYMLRWSFECDNKSIGIKVELLDEENFLKYNSSQAFESITLSSGSHANDSGKYQTKYKTTNYFIFSINETLNITDSIDFEYETWAHITLLFLVFGTPFVLGPLGLIILVVALVSFIKWRDKKKIKEAAVQNQLTDTVIDYNDVIFCGHCGVKNKPTQNYCVKCGSVLTQEVL